MNTPDLDDSTRLGAALHHEVDSVSTDLDALARTSARRGGRIRRWRQAGAVAGVVAVVAATGLGISTLSDGGSTDTDGSSLFASDGSSTSATSPSLSDGQALTLPSGATATVRDVSSALPDGPVPGPISVIADPADGAATSAFLIDAPDASKSDIDWLRHEYGTDNEVRLLLYVGPQDEGSVTVGAAGTNDFVPGNEVTIGLGGWSCPEPADDKTTCSGPDGASVEIVWRQGRGAFLDKVTAVDAMPMLGGRAVVAQDGEQELIVSPAADSGVFVTLTAVTGVDDSSLRQLAASLTWAGMAPTSSDPESSLK